MSCSTATLSNFSPKKLLERGNGAPHSLSFVNPLQIPSYRNILIQIEENKKTISDPQQGKVQYQFYDMRYARTSLTLKERLNF